MPLKSLLVALKSDCSTELLPQQGLQGCPLKDVQAIRRARKALQPRPDRLLVAPKWRRQARSRAGPVEGTSLFWGKCHAAARAEPATPGDRDGLRGAGARRRAGAPGQVHHQPRHRPARLQDAAAHRRGRHQGPARRPSRLHAGPGHPAAARGGGQGPQPPPRRRGRPGHDRHHAGRQAHHVLLDPDVRPARRRDHVSRPRLPHLPLDDPVHRRQAGADRTAGEERVRLHRRPGAVADHAQDQPDHPQQPEQSRAAAPCRPRR